MENNKKKRRFTVPNSYVIIFIMICICAVMTWIVPAGEYDRVLNEAGRSVIVPGSYHAVRSNPIGIIGIFSAIEQGFLQTADIIFFIIFAFSFVNMLMKNGTFDGIMGAVIRKTSGFNVQWLFVVIMMLFGILGSTMGMSEETYGMYPVFIGMAAALGYDAIVGASIVYIGVQVGFASATLNPFTVGVANGIAEITMSSHMLIYRIICFVLFEFVAIIYVWRYATKIKKDPTKSLLYGTEFAKLGTDKTQEELVLAPLTLRHKLCALEFAATIGLLVWGVIAKGWYIDELAVLFLMAMVVVGITGGATPNEIAMNLVDSARGMMFGALIVGISRGILICLQDGMIIDTVLYSLSNMLSGFSGTMNAVVMVVVQNILNFFIPSGSGQAAVSMPIMAPLSDLVGVNRQVAVLAFSFGDGYSNMFWPSGVATAAGLMGLPINKWYKWIAPLFGIFFLMQIVLITVATFLPF